MVNDVTPKTTRNMYEYPETINTLRRCQVSYQYGFGIMNSQVLDLISHARTPEIRAFLKRHILSPSKVQNMTERYGSTRAEQHLKSGPFIVIGDDGKMSLVRQRNGRFKKEDKIGNNRSRSITLLPLHV